ncbi:MAG: hypothetical protein KR126chlam6_00668 [Candidatus Anoxychlamydiales bacterium]|nr:hypothetical protein [Candidatus Anoxychlamydiales bacterium]
MPNAMLNTDFRRFADYPLRSILETEVQKLSDNPDEKYIINEELAAKVGNEFNKCLENLKRQTLFAKIAGILGSVCIISASNIFFTATSPFIAVAFLVSGVGALYIWNRYSNPEGTFATEAANVMRNIYFSKKYGFIKIESPHKEGAYKILEQIAIEIISKGADIGSLVYGVKGSRSPKSLLSWAALSGQPNIVLYLAMIMSNRNKKEKNEKLFNDAAKCVEDLQVANLLNELRISQIFVT